MVVTTIVTESQWRTEHGKNKDRLVVIDFFATWCGPCKQIAPFFDDLSNRYSKEAAFYRVDVDQSQSIAQANGVEAMPTFLFFVNEKKIETVKGADQRRLEQLVKDLSAKHTKNVFKTGTGYSLGGASSSNNNPSARPASGAAGAAGGGGARKNPWADPNFVAKKLNVPADKPATQSSTPTPAPASSSSSSSSSKVPSTPTTTAPAKAPSTPSTTTPAKASAPTTPSAPSSTTSTTPSSQRSEPKGLAALSASAIKEKSSAPPASAPVSTPSNTGNASGTPVDPKLLNGLIDMGIERSHAERALRATTKVGLEGDHHLNAAMDWAFSHPAPTTPAASTPSTNNASSSSSPSPATSAPSSASPAPSSSSSAAAVSAAPAAASSSSSKADEMEMDEDEAVIFAAMKEKLSKEKESNVPMDAASVQSRAEEREQKKLSEMSSEEKTQWLARRKLEVKAKREKEAIEREKDAEKSRRALHAAQSDLKERLEREAVEALAKQKRKEEMERKKVRNDLRDKLKADKERRIKEQAEELERVRKMKEAQAAGKK